MISMSRKKKWGGIEMRKLFCAVFAVVCALSWCETTNTISFRVKQFDEWDSFSSVWHDNKDSAKWLFVVVFLPTSVFSSQPKVQYNGKQFAISELIFAESNSKGSNTVSVVLAGKQPENIAPKSIDEKRIQNVKNIANALDGIKGDTGFHVTHALNSYSGNGKILFDGLIEPTLLEFGIEFVSSTGWGDWLANYWLHLAGAASLGGLYLYHKYHKK
jgi:hypothetical protein